MYHYQLTLKFWVGSPKGFRSYGTFEPKETWVCVSPKFSAPSSGKCKNVGSQVTFAAFIGSRCQPISIKCDLITATRPKMCFPES